MQSFNFRDYPISSLQSVQEPIYAAIANKNLKKPSDQVEELNAYLAKFREKLNEHYINKLRIEKTASPEEQKIKREEALDQANVVFSQLLQSLVYFICHNFEIHADNLLPGIVNHPDFFYVNQSKKVTVWIDPKEVDTALICTARLDNCELVTILDNARKAFGKESMNEFQHLIALTDRHRYSALNSVCKTKKFSSSNTKQRFKNLQKLLDVADDVFGGKNTKGFREFITNLEENQFSPFNSACQAGDVEIVKLLLKAAEDAFGKKTKEYCEFISFPNKDGFSPLNSACIGGHIEIVELLLDEGAIAFDSKEDFEKFTNSKTKNSKTSAGYSPMANAANKGHSKVVKVLLEKAEIKFGGKQNGNFQRLLSTVLHSVCRNDRIEEGHIEVVKLILSAAEVAFGGKDTPEFKNFVDQQTENDGRTPLNLVCFVKDRFDKKEEKMKIKMAEILIEYGANPTIKNRIRQGFSALNNISSYGSQWDFVRDAIPKNDGSSRDEKKGSKNNDKFFKPEKHRDRDHRDRDRGDRDRKRSHDDDKFFREPKKQKTERNSFYRSRDEEENRKKQKTAEKDGKQEKKEHKIEYTSKRD